ncbi:cell elongation-specific peptidoglycan D,D-transpeptidase [Motilibacter rhizosphaerae]|uniref:Cell elongation-specific peptidoglycan D,D-transpeptidase n=1 Tax=Motilibacter rhizosphaerae TaxID=598652 RepID=A0A4Q7NVP8_9ACTN|nr:penicillin-binding protein 2 [Motilibacter rhizosphaerae]RZS91255.1 cell elongation-specific peptidoglycan D,D-transpeptidase [Motilibacter rhizosphaerae]
MNRQLRRMSAALMALFALLLLNATYLQAVDAGSLNSHAGNKRVLLLEYSKERGSILVGRQQVARSVKTTDALTYLRSYPTKGLFASVTGYSSLFSRTGIEKYANSFLSGDDDRLRIRRPIDLVTGQRIEGATVQLTLDAAAQQAASRGLAKAGGKGAVVALDPRTGAVLALQSYPVYDPNLLASHDAGTVLKNYDALVKDPDQPLLDRATSEDFPPGSTFKLVTAAAALSSGKYTRTGKVDGPATLDLPQTTKDLPNENGRPCGDGHPTLQTALDLSCNTVFGAVGLALGAHALQDQADKFGFDDPDLSIPLPVAQSVFPDAPNAPQTAQSAIGQFDVRATPLQMAVVAATIANGGKRMKPYLVDRVTAPDLTVLDKTQPEEVEQAVTPQVARELTTMMVDVVQHGTGTNAQIPGVQVAAKTGTAQAGEGDRPHAWFVAFAPATDPKVAVAVLVQNGGTAQEISGNQVAGPIAKSVIQAVLGGGQ